MLIDLVSPINNWVYSIQLLLSFAVLALLFGTILGIILDLIHHYFIEPFFFEKLEEYKDLIDCYEVADPNRCKKTDSIIYSIFKNCRTDSMSIINYASLDFFYYQEFYANITIAIIPFALILPFYLKHFELPPIWIAVLSILSMSMAFLCFYSSYKTIILFTKICMSFTCTNKCERCNDLSRIAARRDITGEFKLILGIVLVYSTFCTSYIYMIGSNPQRVDNIFFAILLLSCVINSLLAYKINRFPLGTLISISVGLLIAVIAINLIFINPYVDIEPKIISENLIMSDKMVDVQTLTITNLGPDIKETSMTFLGLNKDIAINASGSVTSFL